MNLWSWLSTNDPQPGFTREKLVKLLVRLLLFAVVATLISTLLQLTPLRPYLNTWWGSLIFILLLYVPVARYLSLETLIARPGRMAAPGRRVTASGRQVQSSAQRRKEKHRYAGVKKSGPGGRR